MSYILIFLILLLFAALCVYGMIDSRSTLRRMRIVDVRVLDCRQVQLDINTTQTPLSYYEVNVDLIGLQGETIVKNIRSDKCYEKDDVIRCGYDDKKGVLYLDPDQLKNSGKNGGIILIVLLFFMALVVLGLMGSMSADGQAPDWMRYAFGYFTGILFTGIGLYGILRMKAFSDKKSLMQVTEGTLVDYRKEWSHGKQNTLIYFPIYEYFVGGEARRHNSKIGGNAKKYRQIGRKVTILIDRSADQVYCQEEETSRIKLLMLFFILGLLLLGLMVASNLGYISLS